MTAPQDKAKGTGVDVKAFWENQARIFGEDVTAVNFDRLSDDLELPVFEDLVGDGLDVADVGCGNGRNVLELAAKRSNGRFAGFDFAENMVKVAEARRQRANLTNLRFATFDATASDVPPGTEEMFDIVIAKRLLINVKGPNKHQALRNLHAMLRPGGTYIMCECFVEPLDRVNKIRNGLGLDSIPVKPFNEYLTQGFLPNVEKLFTLEKVIDFASLYYFISRVFNAFLSEGKPQYDAPINQLAARLGYMGVRPMQGYSPEYIHVLKKRSS
jgi:ubiquinone/menaquinone biosynthesis C-methylase UbiE